MSADELRSNILTAIVKEIGRIDPLANGTYTKPDNFQNGQYGKYEKQDTRVRPGGSVVRPTTVTRRPTTTRPTTRTP